MILNGPNGAGATYSDDEIGLNADTFMAQNTTKVKRKPPSSKRSKNQDPEDDDFINEVIEPVKAKTKEELFGPGFKDPTRSRQSSRSRSRSKSNEGKSQRSNSQRKRSGKHSSRVNKMLFNEQSNRSFERGQPNVEQFMAMPTSGGDQDGNLESGGNEAQNLYDLNFDNKRLLNNSSSQNMRKAKGRSALSGKNSHPGSANHLFEENEKKAAQNRKQKVVHDEAFMQKVNQFNNFLE